VLKKRGDLASAEDRKIKNGCDFTLARSQKYKEWPRPCFCRGSSTKNKCDLASAGSRKIKNGQDLTSARDQVPKTNVTLLLQGVNINKFK